MSCVHGQNPRIITRTNKLPKPSSFYKSGATIFVGQKKIGRHFGDTGIYSADEFDVGFPKNTDSYITLFSLGIKRTFTLSIAAIKDFKPSHNTLITKSSSLDCGPNNPTTGYASPWRCYIFRWKSTTKNCSTHLAKLADKLANEQVTR